MALWSLAYRAKVYAASVIFNLSVAFNQFTHVYKRLIAATSLVPLQHYWILFGAKGTWREAARRTAIFHDDLSYCRFFFLFCLCADPSSPSNNSYDEREHTSISLTVTHRDRGVVRCNQDSDTPISLSSFCPSLSALRVQASIQNHNWFPISLSSTLWIHWSRERIVPKYATITDSLLDVASLQKSTLMAKKECDVTTRTQHR